MEDILYKNSATDIRIREMVTTNDSNSKYDFVDLGLPSGTKWAKMNVGAKSVTDHGLYFAWGETQGYADASSGKTFSQNDYKWGTESNFTKYNSTDGKTVLELEDDAARINMGGQWHIPTEEDFNELVNNTTNTWVDNYLDSETCGLLFTSNINGQTLFIPASGKYENAVNDHINYQGYLWTKDLGTKPESDIAFLFYFQSGLYSFMEDGRDSGLTIRAVTK